MSEPCISVTKRDFERIINSPAQCHLHSSTLSRSFLHLVGGPPGDATITYFLNLFYSQELVSVAARPATRTLIALPASTPLGGNNVHPIVHSLLHLFI